MNAQRFPEQMAATASALDLEERMNLISKEVSFKSVETVESTDGTVKTSGIEFIIQKGDDGVCECSQQRVLPDDEPENDIRQGAL